MALMPQRVKFRKFQRGRLKGDAHRGNTVSYGDFGIQSMDRGWITAQQIEAARIAASHFLGGEGKIWIRIFPHKSFSAKPAETRMGKGKGEPSYWAAAVKPGTILFEVGGVPEEAARRAFGLQAYKLPVRTKFAKRRHI